MVTSKNIMEKCPCCKEKGIQTVKITDIDSDGRRTSFAQEIPCILCNGKKEITQEQYAGWLWEQGIWCKCRKAQPNPIYYKDGEHPELHKHHYRCRKCGKVTQIG